MKPPSADPPSRGATLPAEPWSSKRKRQYAHIKTSLLERGKPEPLAEEIAARTVNKERAQQRNLKERSRMNRAQLEQALLR